MSPPMCGCTYRLAIFEPNSRLRTSDGTLKLTRPTSLTGLMTMTCPPRRRMFISVRISRGWFPCAFSITGVGFLLEKERRFSP